MANTLAGYMYEQFTWLQNAEFFIRILIACLCGACIGYERSKRFKEAGIRTHMMVCCAAALMMIVSKYGFTDLMVSGDYLFGTHGVDPARIAAGVVSGVSFLGAGVIFRNGATVKGLTTAAGIWATAGIGLAIGAGMYVLGIFVTLIIALFQIIMHKIQVGVDAYVTSHMQFTVKNDANFRQQFLDFLSEHRVQISASHIELHENGEANYDLILRTPRQNTVEEITTFLTANETVKNISLLPGT